LVGTTANVREAIKRQWGKKDREAGKEGEKSRKGPKPGKNNPFKS
jgi:hypothetical protein